MRPQKRGKWRLFREDDRPSAGLSTWAYVALFALSMAFGFWSVANYNGVVVWTANGVLIAAILQLPRRQALGVLACCALINLGGNIYRHDAPHMIVLNAALNFAEALAVAALVRRYCGATLDLRRPMRLARFTLCAAAPVALSALIGVPAKNLPADEMLLNLNYWFTIETLGILVTTPAILLLARSQAFADDLNRSRTEKAVLLAFLVAVTTVVFSQSIAPVAFLVFIPLLLIGFRLQPHWSAIAVLVVAAISSMFTLNELGPFTLSHMGPRVWSDPHILPILNALPPLHLFLGASLVLAFGASTVLSERRALEQRLKSRTETAQRARAAAEVAEQRVTFISRHDFDTQLLNRVGLEDAAESMLALRGGRDVFIAALRIDRFSAIRTAIGAQQASDLVREAALRLQNGLRRAATARLSADTLGVALRASDVEDATRQLSAATAAFADPVAIGLSRVDIHFTIGAAGAPQHAQDARSLIDRAQVALDQACLARSTFALFNDDAERAAAGGLALLSDLRLGLENGAVWLAHQPKLDLHSGQWRSAECLLRWTHPERGAMSPASFIPLLEETGAISSVTEWVVRQALREQALLQGAGAPLNVAVNISARSLSEAGFAQSLHALVPQGRESDLTLEITETALMTHEDVAVDNLAALKAAGFRISIDDYGAGMSSLSYLKRIPATELKIDSAFVKGMASNGTDSTLVRSTIDLAHNLGLTVVAEGVEDESTLELLRRFNCDYAQGYHIARPMPVQHLLDANRARVRSVA